MEQQDIGFLYKTLGSLYPTFETPPRLMQQLWLDELRAYDRPLVVRAIRQWACQHTDHPPTLAHLCEQIRWGEDEDRRVMRRENRQRLSHTLGDAGAAQAANPERTPEEASYGQLMALLAYRHLDAWVDSQGVKHPKLSRAQMAEQCHAWAIRARDAQRRDLAADLDHAGSMWRTWAEQLGQTVHTAHMHLLGDEEDPALAFLK
mgnify:CR=1 FL=1